jgi:hypothetical protein
VSPRALRAGAALALLYVVVAVATSELSSRPVLPLFDGFAPPVPYNWVNPPPDRARDNVPPKPAEREFPLVAEGSPAANASTDDAQAIVGLDKGSVPPHSSDTGLVVKVVPFDAGTLGPLPPGLRVVSNAYQVSISYVPSQTPVSQLAMKGTMAMTAAEAGDKMLFSADGQTWEERPSQAFGQDHGLFTELDRLGWFVIATSAPAPSGSGGGSGPLRVVLLVLAGVAPIVGAVLVLRLPSPVPAAPAGRARRGGRRPTAKKPVKRRR